MTQEGADKTEKKGPKIRQAVVIVHGMGEQRPLDTLFRFANAVVKEPPSSGEADTSTAKFRAKYFSRPTNFEDAFESRYLVSQKSEKDDPVQQDQADFFEYHWSFHMQGNKFTDIIATFFRMLIRSPTRVPSGLLVVWAAIWLLIFYAAYKLYSTPDIWSKITAVYTNDGTGGAIAALIGTIFAIGAGGLAFKALRWLFKRFIPAKVTSHFVDVIRYLDTSPRSYAVRKNIRKGMVDLIENLHQEKEGGKNKYDRVVIVAHSLGAYIAYDAITYYWTRTNQQFSGKIGVKTLRDVEQKGAALLDASEDHSAEKVDDYRKAQKALWLELQKQGNPWRISDFVSVGTPMYMADSIMTKNKARFQERVDLRHIAKCPPESDLSRDGFPKDPVSYGYPYGANTALYHAAPFAVTRWTNMWFPPALNFFGDWFGGPLAPLFGHGIRDIRLKGDGWRRFIPAVAHALYFSFPDKKPEAGDDPDKTDQLSVTHQLRLALDLSFFR
ncbi:hypothetical protein [Pontixanthobacter aquaemixtae]|uniref:Uncharacterized protein n=1 Tax=Pontixanthobacter aquaemixtae TaxID=1958940 RepID=A0A844ZQK0_9SPHN|nr:hypothetical protein [Pontixanthobacter aquaemixtae]MXO89306.1 hypothetical protein [Pontixanthobacter aquaemixtae]